MIGLLFDLFYLFLYRTYGTAQLGVTQLADRVWMSNKRTEK